MGAWRLQLGRVGTPEIEYLSADPVLLLDGVGLDEMAKAWHNWLRAWEELHVDETTPRARRRACFVLVRYSGRGNPDGLQVKPIDAACLFHLHAGNVVKLVLYWDRSGALADLGLAPEAGSAQP